MAHLLFLSHAGIDSEAAKALAVRLEAAGGAAGETVEVWIDKRHLAAGGRWKDALQEALRQSTAFAVYVGTRGVIKCHPALPGAGERRRALLAPRDEGGGWCDKEAEQEQEPGSKGRRDLP
jgi:hypothetical protein